MKQRAIQRGLVIAAAAITCVAVPANDHESKSSDKQAYGEKAQHGDKSTKFISETLACGETEIKMGQLGQQRAQNAEVKRLAERLVQDHQQGNQELQQIAQKKGIQADTQGKPDAHAKSGHEKGKDHMAMLEKASGADFDKQFVTHAIKGHKKSIANFEKCSKDITDTEVKAFIDKTLPKLREHLTMAQAAAGAVGVSKAELSALETDTSDASGAPAGGEIQSEDDIDRANKNQEEGLTKPDSSGGAANPEASSESSSSSAPETDSSGAAASAEIESSSSQESPQPESSSSSSESSTQPESSGAAASSESASDSASVSAESSISSPESQPESSTPDSSASYQSDASASLDGATRSDSSLTISQNNPSSTEIRSDLDAQGSAASNDTGSGLNASAQIGDNSASIDANADIDRKDNSISADVDVDTDSDASIRTDLDTDKGDGKILGVETKEGDGEILGVESKDNDGKILGVRTEKGDNKVLGLSTDKRDGRLLGIIPWRGGDKDVEVDADVDTDDGVNVRADVDTDSVGGPAVSATGSASSETVQFNKLPENVKSAIRNHGGDNNTTIRKMTVYEVEVKGKKMHVHEDGTMHSDSHSSTK